MLTLMLSSIRSEKFLEMVLLVFLVLRTSDALMVFSVFTVVLDVNSGLNFYHLLELLNQGKAYTFHERLNSSFYCVAVLH